MDPLRKTSLVFGLFFAGTFVFSIPALIFYDSVLHDPGYILVGGFDARISTGALFEVLLAICNIATAIVIYPVAKRVKEAVALGYVASRTVESVIILAGVISLMSIVTLRAGFAPGGNTESLGLAGRSLLAFHDWTFLLGPQFCAGFGNGLLLGYLMYRSGLVPRRMAVLGPVGGPLAFVGGVLVLFDALKPFSPGLIALTIPEVAWELSITIYPIVKGFRPSPVLDNRLTYSDHWFVISMGTLREDICVLGGDEATGKRAQARWRWSSRAHFRAAKRESDRLRAKPDRP